MSSGDRADGHADKEEPWRDTLAAGRLPTLAEFGGPVGLLEQFEVVANEGEFPYVVGLLAESWEAFNAAESASAQQVILRAAVLDDPLQTPDVLERVLSNAPVLSDLGRDLASNSAELSRHNKGLVGGASIEAVVRLALGGYSRKTFALGLLSEVADDLGSDHDSVEHEWFLRSWCRAAGAALEAWPDPAGEIYEILESVATDHVEVVDDACFELGMAQLRLALRAEHITEARSSLQVAVDWLRRCIRYNDERPDAEVFAAAIDVTLRFVDGARLARDDVSRVRELARQYIVERSGEEVGWRRERSDIAAAWWSLVACLADLADLDDEQWWAPADLIASIGDAYSACRTLQFAVDLTPARSESNILAPRITSALLHDGQRIAFVDRWLAEFAAEDVGRTEAIERLRRSLRDAGPEPPGKVEPRSGVEDIQSALMIDRDLAGRVSEALDEYDLLPLVMSAVRQHSQTWSAGFGLYFDKIHHRLLSELSESPDYQGSVRAAVDQLVLGLLLFARDRLDAEAGSPTGPHYLRRLSKADDDPVEAELAEDLRGFLRGTIRGAVRNEVRNRGSGRVDLTYIWPEFEISIECKRRIRGEGSGRIGRQLAQAEQYQVADVPIGFLVILDLNERLRLQDLGDCVWMERGRGSGPSGREKFVSVFVIQGNKPTPSSLK